VTHKAIKERYHRFPNREISIFFPQKHQTAPFSTSSQVSVTGFNTITYFTSNSFNFYLKFGWKSKRTLRIVQEMPRFLKSEWKHVLYFGSDWVIPQRLEAYFQAVLLKLASR
jgi:hypothetical protein